jgi:hypothetical protein
MKGVKAVSFALLASDPVVNTATRRYCLPAAIPATSGIARVEVRATRNNYLIQEHLTRQRTTEFVALNTFFVQVDLALRTHKYKGWTEFCKLFFIEDYNVKFMFKAQKNGAVMI